MDILSGINEFIASGIFKIYVNVDEWIYALNPSLIFALYVGVGIAVFSLVVYRVVSIPDNQRLWPIWPYSFITLLGGIIQIVYGTWNIVLPELYGYGLDLQIADTWRVVGIEIFHWFIAAFIYWTLTFIMALLKIYPAYAKTLPFILVKNFADWIRGRFSDN